MVPRWRVEAAERSSNKQLQPRENSAKSDPAIPYRPAIGETSKAMPFSFETMSASAAIPIIFATKSTWETIRADLPEPARRFAIANGFSAKPGACLTLPTAEGRFGQVLFGLEDTSSKSRDPFRAGALPGLLPGGVYRFANAPHDI